MNVRDGNDVTYSVDNLSNRYTSIDSNAPQYDNAGNLTTDWRGYGYQYDYENRITKITKDGNDIAEFTYDALGRRIEVNDVVTPANTRCYSYGSGWQAITIDYGLLIIDYLFDSAIGGAFYFYDNSELYRELFVFGNDIDETVFVYDVATGAYLHYVHDHLGNVVALVNLLDGSVLERYEYDAYGEPNILDAD